MYDDGVVLDPDCSDCGPPHALPDEVELTPPGAQLGLMLAGAADRSVLSGPDLLVLTQARVRQIAHLQAQLMADLVAIAGRCQPRMSEPPPGSGRRAEPVDHAVDEIAAALTWTNTAAGNQLDFAERLVQCLPEVHAAMLAGRIDWPKAKVLADGITGLDPQTARTVTSRLLADAAERTTGQLRARLAKLVILADPDAARRRYRHGLKGRRVEHGREDDGTARLTGRWLPAARAAAANTRIQAIADWIKDGGDTRTVDQIRADILLDLLQGRPVPGPDGQPRHHLPGDPDHPDTEDHPDHDINGDHTDIEGDEGNSADSGDASGDGGGGLGAPATRPANIDRPGRDRERKRERAGPPDADPDFADLSWPDPGDRPPDQHDPPDPDRSPRAGPEPTDADRPDDDTGAREDSGGDTSVDEAANADGNANAGNTNAGKVANAAGRAASKGGRAASKSGRAGSKGGRRRVGPRGACPTCGQTKLTRGLELTAPITTLLGLADHPGQLGSWGPVIAETTRALVADLINAPWRISLTDNRGTVIWHGPVRTRPDPTERRRFPTPTQAAHVRARDRRCRFPSCRRPAARAELDHSIPHTHDGPTHECNLCCLCIRHHILKTAGLWTPWQQDNGNILWRSALGRTYRTEPEPAEEPTST